MADSRMADSVLLPKKSLLRGLRSLFDFNGSMDHSIIEEIRNRYHSPPPIASAEDSIRSTWQAVGESMRWAIGEYDKDFNEKNRE